MKEYYKLEECINLIEEPNRTCSLRLLDDNLELFRKARGSKSNHQAWEGGYLDHITEGMNIGIKLYPLLDNLRKLPFTLSDVNLTFNLHDLEKPWKYKLNAAGQLEIIPEMQDRKNIKAFVDRKIIEYGFVLTEEHRNALKYAEGEVGDWTPGKRLMGPLAAFIHMCDNWSARGWFDYPMKSGDPWKDGI